jgi:hypothetical protein
MFMIYFNIQFIYDFSPTIQAIFYLKLALTNVFFVYALPPKTYDF